LPGGEHDDRIAVLPTTSFGEPHVPIADRPVPVIRDAVVVPSP
jgi:hypothetical protein